jgi:hypothetical protein
MVFLNLVRQRRDWVLGEVRCLACARLIGRLLGSRHGADGRLKRSESVKFFAYRSAEANSSVVAYRPGMRLRCATCGGTGALDDIETLSIYEEAPGAYEDAEPPRRGPGRPRQPFKTPDEDPLAPELTLLRSQA